MLNLLLDEDQYESAIEELAKFAESQGIEMDYTSESILQVAATVMLAAQPDARTFVMLSKLIYNLGYRDNHVFSKLKIH